MLKFLKFLFKKIGVYFEETLNEKSIDIIFNERKCF